MRWFATLLVVMSVVHIASSARTKAPLKPTVSFANAREQKYLSRYARHSRSPQKVLAGKSFEELQQFAKEAFPVEAVTPTTEALQKDRTKALPEVVKVAELDFNTDIKVITNALRGFGNNLVQKALAKTPSKWQEALGLYGFGSGHWSGGWVIGCPDEGSTQFKQEVLYIGTVDGVDCEDEKQREDEITMVPCQWWVQKDSGINPHLMYNPKGFPCQNDVKAIRRATKSWTLFGKQPNLCLWTGPEVIVLNDDIQQCWSHKISIENRYKIVDLCN